MVTGYWVTQIVRAAASYSIVGGLIVSQALTLYTTPIVFL
jgi:hypothetical protein